MMEGEDSMTVKDITRPLHWPAVVSEKEIGGEYEMSNHYMMPTKRLEREEIFPGKLLRSTSQKKLLEMVEKFDKTGVIMNDDLAIAMLSWNRYEELVNLIEVQDERIQELENTLEDIQLSQTYRNAVIQTERGENKEYKVDSIDEVFDSLI